MKKRKLNLTMCSLPRSRSAMDRVMREKETFINKINDYLKMDDADVNELTLREFGELRRKTVVQHSWMTLIESFLSWGRFKLYYFLLNTRKDGKLDENGSHDLLKLIEKNGDLKFLLAFFNVGNVLFNVNDLLSHAFFLDAWSDDSRMNHVYFERLTCCKEVNKGLYHTLHKCLYVEEALCKGTDEIPKDVRVLILNLLRYMETIAFGHNIVDEMNQLPFISSQAVAHLSGDEDEEEEFQ